MYKKFLFVFAMLLVLAGSVILVTACGDDDNSGSSDTDTDTDSDTDTDADGEFTLTAATADGPCGPGSIYFIRELDPVTFEQVFQDSGSTDSLGRITNKTLKENTPYEMWVNCYDFNEITGTFSDSLVTLFTFLVTGEAGATPDGGVIPETPGNITDISHFLSTYVKNTYIAGADHTHEAYETIKNNAFASLISQLDFIVSPADLGDCDVNELNIVSGSSSCNDTALAVELAVRNYAVRTAEAEGQPQTAFLQNTLDGLKFAFEDGDLTGDLITAITASVPTLDVVAANANLTGYLTPLGGEAPNADTVLDMDNDDVPNATDPDIDGDGFANADDEAPYDGAVGGGMYIDIVNSLAWQLAPSVDTYTWADAQTYCDGLSLGGHDDWRMPTISELRALVKGCEETEVGGSCEASDACASVDCDVNCSGCAANDGPATGGCYWGDELSGECGEYWTVTAYTGVTEPSAWLINFNNAFISGSALDGAIARIRCVRTLP